MSLIVSQLKIVQDQPVLIAGACISCLTLLCLLLPLWLGFPFIISTGILLVFMAILLFRFPQVCSPKSVLGTFIIQADVGAQQTAQFQLLPEKRIEKINLSATGEIRLDFLIITSEFFCPLYGGRSWLILKSCVVNTEKYNFLQSSGLVFTMNSSIAQFLEILFGFRLSQQQSVISLENIEKNVKHHIEWRPEEKELINFIPW